MKVSKTTKTTTKAAAKAEAAEDQSTGLTVLPEGSPKVGDRVHFHPNEEHQAELGVFDAQQPCHARVLYAWGGGVFNLEVTGPSGAKLAVQNVRFVPEGDAAPEGESFATAAA